MEDGVVLAIVLSLTKFSPSIPEENKVQTALKAYQKLRMERVKSAQKTGVEVMELWHAADWEKVKQNPESMKLPRDDWLLLHDCEKWTRGIWDEALEELRGGKKIPRERLAAGEDSTEVFYF